MNKWCIWSFLYVKKSQVESFQTPKSRSSSKDEASLSLFCLELLKGENSSKPKTKSRTNKMGLCRKQNQSKGYVRESVIKNKFIGL